MSSSGIPGRGLVTEQVSTVHESTKNGLGVHSRQRKGPNKKGTTPHHDVVLPCVKSVADLYGDEGSSTNRNRSKPLERRIGLAREEKLSVVLRRGLPISSFALWSYP